MRLRRRLPGAAGWLHHRAGRHWTRPFTDFLVHLWHEIRADRVTGLAAEVAFFAVLSVFPGLIAVAAAVGSLESLIGDDAASEVRDTVVTFFERVLTSDASGTIDAVDELFEERSSGALTVGVVGALWAMSRGFAALMNALDVVYDLDERRSYVRRRALSLLFSFCTVVVAAVTLAMMVAGPLLGTGQDVAEALGRGEAFATLWNLLRWPVTVVVLVGWAWALLHYAPNHDTPWRWDFAGAGVAAAVWLAVTVGFRAYLAVASGTNQVFGTLGGALIILVWLYLLGLGLLVGGEVNAILARRHAVPKSMTTLTSSGCRSSA